MAEDFYDTLGISREASDSEIKSAYRKLAMKYHPDRNQGDSAAEQKFKDVSQAYEILKDTKKRQADTKIVVKNIFLTVWPGKFPHTSCFLRPGAESRKCTQMGSYGS